MVVRMYRCVVVVCVAVRVCSCVWWWCVVVVCVCVAVCGGGVVVRVYRCVVACVAVRLCSCVW